MQCQTGGDGSGGASCYQLERTNPGQSASFPQPIPQEIVQIVDVLDFLTRDFDRVFNPTILDGFSIPDHVTGAAVKIPGLANAPNIDDQFLLVDREFSIDISRADELVVGREDARHVRVSLETLRLNKGKQAVHFLRVVLGCFDLQSRPLHCLHVWRWRR